MAKKLLIALCAINKVISLLKTYFHGQALPHNDSFKNSIYIGKICLSKNNKENIPANTVIYRNFTEAKSLLAKMFVRLHNLVIYIKKETWNDCL